MNPLQENPKRQDHRTPRIRSAFLWLRATIHIVWLRIFPWTLPLRARRILGCVGGGWLMFQPYALGLLEGTHRLTPAILGAFVVNVAVGLGLVAQMPRRPCTCETANLQSEA